MSLVRDPPLHSLREGQTLDVVLELFHVQDGLYHAQATRHQEACLLRGRHLDAPAIWTLYGVQYVGRCDSVPLLACTDVTQAFRKPAVTPNSFYMMTELCAGIGGISLGMLETGGRVAAYVDKNPLACKVLRQHGPPVLEGDINDGAVRQALHRTLDGVSSVLAAGVPCQGYSRQGRGLGYDDPRSKVPLSVLQTLWHIQSPGLLIECVTEIQHSREAMQALLDFARQAKYQVHEVRLELAHQSVARRHRWWCLLVPASMPAIEIVEWPRMAETFLLGSAIPQWPVWPDDQEAELMWDEAEKAAYSDEQYGRDTRLLTAHMQAPTVLHRYGCPLQACPCGCRQASFAEHRLRTQGLRGFGIMSQVRPGPRYLHPRELSFLNTVPLDAPLNLPMRDVLCLLGQLAAPMQSLWILTQLQDWSARLFGGKRVASEDELSAFKRKLRHQQHNTWLLPSLLQGGLLHMSDPDGSWAVSVSGPVTAQEVAAARSKLMGPGVKTFLRDEGRQLHPGSLLHFGQDFCYEVTTLRKRQAVRGPQPAASGKLSNGSADVDQSCLCPTSNLEPSVVLSAATPRGDSSVSVASPAAAARRGDSPVSAALPIEPDDQPLAVAMTLLWYGTPRGCTSSPVPTLRCFVASAACRHRIPTRPSFRLSTRRS